MIKNVFLLLFASLLLFFAVIPTLINSSANAFIPPPPDGSEETPVSCGSEFAGVLNVKVKPAQAPIGSNIEIVFDTPITGRYLVEIHNKIETARLFQDQINLNGAPGWAYRYTLSTNDIQTVKPGKSYWAVAKIDSNGAEFGGWLCGKRLFFVLNEDGGLFTAPDKKEYDHGFTTLSKVEVQGLPSGDYKFKLSGKWKGDFLRDKNGDTFRPNNWGLIDINWICDNGEAGRLPTGDNPCKDTFEPGTYKIELVLADNGQVIDSRTFKVVVQLSEAGGEEVIHDLPGQIVTPIGTIDSTGEGLAQAVLSLGVGAAGGVAFLMMVFGAYRLMFAGGNPEAIQQGREFITSAIVGLVVVVLAIFLLDLIGVSILGLDIL